MTTHVGFTTIQMTYPRATPSPRKERISIDWTEPVTQQHPVSYSHLFACFGCFLEISTVFAPCLK